MDSYGVIEGAVKDYWRANYPQDVVAFFQQKYSWDDKWERCEELVECHGSDDYENMTFLYDFCEGQTEVKDVVIIPLCEVTAFYFKRRIANQDVAPVVHGKWEITDAYPHNVHCSVCHKRFAQTHWEVWEDGSLPRDYCPNCGAKMDGEA